MRLLLLFPSICIRQIVRSKAYLILENPSTALASSPASSQLTPAVLLCGCGAQGQLGPARGACSCGALQPAPARQRRGLAPAAMQTFTVRTFSAPSERTQGSCDRLQESSHLARAEKKGKIEGKNKEKTEEKKEGKTGQVRSLAARGLARPGMVRRTAPRCAAPRRDFRS